jgi:cytochrome c553
MKKIITALFCLVSLNAVAGGNAVNGEALTKKYNCAACHGADFNHPVDPGYPKLAGQHADYIIHALTAYKRGDAPNGRANAIMGGQVKPLSGQDMKDIAAYLSGLPSQLTAHR